METEKKPGPETNCGVYMLISRTTGQSYIGCSYQLASRLESHLAAIKSRRGTDKYLAAFPIVDDLEIRVLEYCQYREVDVELGWDDPEFDRQDDLEREDQWALHECERHWILTLQPTLNKQKRVKRLDLESLPVGPPEASNA